MRVASNDVKFYAIIWSVIWTLVVIVSFIWSYSQLKANTLEVAKSEARIAFQKDLLYRKWAAQHGGIYVPTTSETPPNPNLPNSLERDISTPSGKALTLINPAYMTRQVFELATKNNDFVRGHITSLNPIRKENAPDPWERAVLKAFEGGVEEVSEVQTIAGQQYLRLMRPFVTEQPCLKCHAQQGYKIGDIRGGISVSIPLSEISRYSKGIINGTGAAHVLVWFLGICMIGLSSNKLSKSTSAINEKRKQLEDEIAERQKIQERLDFKAKKLEAEINSRKQSEEALQTSEGIFRDLFYNSNVAISMTEIDGRLRANKAFCRIPGYTEEELNGLRWQEITHPDDIEISTENVNAVISREKETANWEKRYIHKDGHVVLVDMQISLQRDNKGNPLYFITTITDITERRCAEEEKAKLEEQLRQSQKMESVGRLAGGVAHDFNNMLGVILGYSDMELNRMEPPQPHYASFVEIKKAAERSADLTRQLLAFARKQTINPQIIDLNETISKMLKMLQRLIGEDICLKLQADADLWPVKIDPSQIDQIMANLCVNARDAIDGEGKISIEIGNCTFDADCGTDELPGEYVQLLVSDNGCGMDRETLDHIFEPFFTTKGLEVGTGLGLATVFGIVKQNDGFINVYSKNGLGTTFKLYFPRVTLEKGFSSAEAPEPTIISGSGTVLLVEDEASLRKMVSGMLTQLGYQVVVVKTPMDAIALCKTDDFKQVDVILTDVVMPEMNGKEMCNRILAQHPDIPVLFMSGFTADIIESRGILEESVNFIHKPFNLQKLSRMIWKTMGQRTH
ncbi:MAG: DUF3365 domain-containing protein [Oryzomonas sp.]|uniref:PAS domain S-box protein n=1 Tax=Oryzomonas sp. TaxID=2855186 RepID=UPI0028506EC9|nr:PAS domain S-box protein [Oryzomonas sp.]MDR3580485.1 DUF3365 domain-containing protein [Oryzomonas sp.]